MYNRENLTQFLIRKLPFPFIFGHTVEEIRVCRQILGVCYTEMVPGQFLLFNLLLRNNRTEIELLPSSVFCIIAYLNFHVAFRFEVSFPFSEIYILGK